MDDWNTRLQASIVQSTSSFSFLPRSFFLHVSLTIKKKLQRNKNNQQKCSWFDKRTHKKGVVEQICISRVTYTENKKKSQMSTHQGKEKFEEQNSHTVFTTDTGMPIDSNLYSLTIGTDGPILLQDFNFIQVRIPKKTCIFKKQTSFFFPEACKVWSWKNSWESCSREGDLLFPRRILLYFLRVANYYD